MRKTNLLLAFTLLIGVATAWAALCPQCQTRAFIANIGECSQCDKHTSSGAFKLCKTCSAKEHKCEACLRPIQVANPGKPNPLAAMLKNMGKQIEDLAAEIKKKEDYLERADLTVDAAQREQKTLEGMRQRLVLLQRAHAQAQEAAKRPRPKPLPRPGPGGIRPSVNIKAKLAKDIAGIEGEIKKIQELLKTSDLSVEAGKEYDLKLKQLNLRLTSLKRIQTSILNRPQPRPGIRPGGRKPFPKHWGAPPRIQTRDLRPLPGGYGTGSSTLAGWIQKNLDNDAKNKEAKPPNAPKAPEPNVGPPPAVTIDPVAPPVGGAKTNPDHVAKVKAALAAWEKAKKDCGGNYEYTVGFTSAFGFGNTTTIVVKNNKVVERRYEEFNRQAPPPPGAKPNGFVEKGAGIGTNKKGAPAKTLDELYQNAAAIAAQPLPNHLRRYIRTNKAGLLLSCFTVDTRIADDAPTKGVNVGQIKLGAKKAEGKPARPAQQVHRAPNGKPFPEHWGAPPRIQTRDLRPLPGGYGSGSGTLARWIQQNLDRDATAASTTKPHNPGKPAKGNKAKEIEKLRGEIAKLQQFLEVARLTKPAYERYTLRLKRMKNRLDLLENGRAKPSKPAPPNGNVRPKPSKEFSARHPKGSYVPGRLLVGMEKGRTQAQCQEALAGAIPGLKVTKGMFNNTILVVVLPDTLNEEQAIAALKKVDGVKYAELDGIATIQNGGGGSIGPGPGIQIQPAPRIQR